MIAAYIIIFLLVVFLIQFYDYILGRILPGDKATIEQAPSWIPERYFAEIIAKSGGGQAALFRDGKIIHRTSWGVRFLGLGLSGVVIYFTLVGWGMVGAQPDGKMQFDASFWSILTVLTYINLQNWFFRVSYDDQTLWVTGPAFIQRAYRFQDLVAVEEDGMYLYKLRFRGKGSVSVYKTVAGAKELKQTFNIVLGHNYWKKNRDHYA